MIFLLRYLHQICPEQLRQRLGRVRVRVRGAKEDAGGGHQGDLQLDLEGREPEEGEEAPVSRVSEA